MTTPLSHCQVHGALSKLVKFLNTTGINVRNTAKIFIVLLKSISKLVA